MQCSTTPHWIKLAALQTASIVLLPLELPDYNPRILVVGGSSMDHATPTTPATNNTYLLDLSQASCNSGCPAVGHNFPFYCAFMRPQHKLLHCAMPNLR